MPLLHLGPLQLEVRRRPFAGMMIPAVGEQDAADIQKHAVIAVALFIVLTSVRPDHRCHRIRASSSGIATPS